MTETLLHWFEQNRRRLPWRYARSPYRVWIAEVMLQQTQVRTVVPYFEAWLERFPDVRSLAEAELDSVLKAWEGLGYYRRARLLHRCAQLLCQDWQGRLPESYQQLRRLPGLGSYSAAAIASIAFGEAVLAIDANVRRVASRLFMLSKTSDAVIQQALAEHLPADRPGDFNEALMELGATLCRAQQPRCDLCPLMQHCAAYQAQQVAAYPAAKAKRQVPRLERFALICYAQGQLWLQQRSEQGMLAGLWGFALCVQRPPGHTLPAVRHAYSHFSLRVTPVLVSLKTAQEHMRKLQPPQQNSGQNSGQDPSISNAPLQAVSLETIPQLALSTLDHKILRRWQALQAKTAPPS